MKISKLGLGAAALAAGLGFGVLSAAAADVTFKFAYWVPDKHPLNPTGFQVWAESIKKASNGSIDFVWFPAQQLGKAPDHYDMARDGIADFTLINPGYQPGRFPIIAATELPFHVTNAKAGTRAVDEWYRQYADKEMGDVKLCVAILHDPGTIHAKKKVTSPADIKGLNVRPAQATMARFVNMLGGASVQVSAPEARDALAKGAADAITFPWNSIVLFGIDNVTKHHLDMPFYVTVLGIAMNKPAYEKLSDANKKVIDDHCTPEWAEKVAAGWADWEAAGREKLAKTEGHILYQATPEEKKAWQEAAAPLLDAWKKDVTAKGDDPDAIYQSLKATLAKYDSAYE